MQLMLAIAASRRLRVSVSLWFFFVSSWFRHA